MKIAVIDGQGGGIGKLITDKLRNAFSEKVEILALGTNALATTNMLKAGANEGATGESAICYNAGKVDVITGSLAVTIPYAFLGELTPAMAAAVAQSSAKKILLPINKCGVDLALPALEPLPHQVEQLVLKLKRLLADNGGV